jgi:hypothetical protein
MRLIYQSTKAEVKVGDVTHVRNQPYIITLIREPHTPASTGRVCLRSMCERGYYVEYYPSVVDAEWVEREDRQ